MATAGYMWPPVPPAAKTTRRLSTTAFWVARAWLLDCCRDKQKVIFNFKVLGFAKGVAGSGKFRSLGVRERWWKAAVDWWWRPPCSGCTQEVSRQK
ncbi:hypothetical protein ACFX1R_049594 [Malus domestica]